MKHYFTKASLIGALIFSSTPSCITTINAEDSVNSRYVKDYCYVDRYTSGAYGTEYGCVYKYVSDNSYHIGTSYYEAVPFNGSYTVMLKKYNYSNDTSYNYEPTE